MNRTSRINTIWRKELIDTLRDRRTVIAMVLVPMVLYPALMLGSMQAFELQVSSLASEEYTIAVPDTLTQRWLRRLIDEDPARQFAEPSTTAEEVAKKAVEFKPKPSEGEPAGPADDHRQELARSGVHDKPPPYRIVVVQDVQEAVVRGDVQVGVMLRGRPPAATAEGSVGVTVAYDDSDIRSEIAAAGLEGVLERAANRILARRLAAQHLPRAFIEPIAVEPQNVAPPERMAGATLGQIVPLILILMTITGAIYPAIDLTAGERERGTLETLMAAPVPTSDLVVGKFIVVTIIGLLSAVLNLLSVGGTIYLGGVGSVLTQGRQLVFPLCALPWVFVLLVPLAVMFSAMLLAVCSFARSFKEAQNYIAPVMMAALIPGVVGILPGTRLEGPIVVMPVANIVVLTRELFLGKFDYAGIAIVALTTCLYAGAAIAIATKLFGQEAVLFADSGSIRTIFQRRFFKPRPAPSVAVVLLVLAVVYSLNFYLQSGMRRAGISGGVPFLGGTGLILVVLFGIGPWLTAVYVRADPIRTFRLKPPSGRAMLAALCFGASTWVLMRAWLVWQSSWMPINPQIESQMQAEFDWINQTSPWLLVFFFALVPALCEELFFRGFLLSGVRTSLNAWASVGLVSLAFGLSHYMIERLPMTFILGLILAILVVRFGSIYPAMLAHFMHNTLSTLATHPAGLAPLLDKIGLANSASGLPASTWLFGALALAAIGLALCIRGPRSANQPANGRAAAIPT